MAKRIACIVEGHGDVEAVPVLVRRIAAQIDPPVIVQVTAPLRIPKSKLVKPGELERAVEFAARRVVGGGGVLVVLDSDDDCPAVVGPALLARATGVRDNFPVAVVLAKREFESWFLAAAESLAGFAGLAANLNRPPLPENIRGAKEWLTGNMEGTRSYSPTLDQPILARQFDLQAALCADSFGKFLRETRNLLLQLPDIQ